jgi:hypothetical protein
MVTVSIFGTSFFAVLKAQQSARHANKERATNVPKKTVENVNAKA